MSGTVSTLSSTTKGDPPASTGTKQPSKTGFDHLDVNKLFKGKTAEPTTKLVAQKHGMQTLGKVLPARRAGGPVLSLNSGEPSSENLEDRKGPSAGDPPTNFQDPNQGWANQQHQQRPYPAQSPLAIANQIPIPPLLEKKWSGGRADGNYPASRFAQEFPTLDAAVGEGVKVPPAGGPPQGHRSQTKSQDNQYGPGPILRPQTEGSWIQGGGGRRPSPPSQQPNFPPERGPMGGPVPQLAVGQIPPPLGGYHPTFRPNQPNMYQKPGGGGFYPGGPPNSNPSLRFGMPIPHDAPPPGHSVDSIPPPLRRAGGPPPRPTSHFTSKPIIKQEELERMDEIGTHDGDWASTNDDVDYNKRISFSDEEDQQHHTSHSKRSLPTTHPIPNVRPENKAPLHSHPVNMQGERQDLRMEDEERPVRQYRDSDEDWRPTRLVDKDTGRQGQGDRGSGRNKGRDDDWRSGPRTSFGDEFRGKKVAPPPPQQQRDSRPPDFHKQIDNKFTTNVPPRFRQQQNQNQPPQRHTPSPNANANGGKEPPPPYKILERKRGESESSRESNQNQSIDKRKFPSDHTESRGMERDGKEDYRKREPQTQPGGLKKEEVEKRLTPSTSWAEEMDEDESLNAISEIRKAHHKDPSPVLKKEERRDRIESKRIIKQTKVADMQTITKQESPPTKSIPPQNKEVKAPSKQNQEQTQSNSGPNEWKPVEVKPNSAWADVEKNLPKAEPDPQQLRTMKEQDKDKVHSQAKNTRDSTKHPRHLEREDSKEVQPLPKHVPKEEEGIEKKELVVPQLSDKEEKKEHDERKGGDSDQFYKRGGTKPAPPRKNSRESRHPPHLNPPNKVQDFIGDGGNGMREEGKRPQQTTQQKSHENNLQHKEQRAAPGGGDTRKEERRGPVPSKHNQPKQQAEPKQQPPPKVDESKGKNASEEGVRRPEKGQSQSQGSVWSEKRKPNSRQQQPKEEESNESSAGKDSHPTGEVHRKAEGDAPDFRRQNKSPSAAKRSERNAPSSHHGAGGRGASRLQGYGPPSDRSPFSNTNKEPDDDRKEKERKDGAHSTRLVIPPPTSGPVPLMALGEISPPDLPLRGRHHEFGRPPRFQRSFPPPQRGHKQATPNLRGSGKGQKKGTTDSDGESQQAQLGGGWNKGGKPGGGNDESSKGEQGRGGMNREIGVDGGNDPNLPQSPSSIAPPTGDPLTELSSNKVPTMVFENTKLKLSDTQQQQQTGKSLPAQQQPPKGLERNSPGVGGGGLGQEKGGLLPFPKEPSPVKLDFGSTFGEERLHATSRPYPHPHEPHYRGTRSMSPLQADLPDNLRSIWESPALPSDHSTHGGSGGQPSGPDSALSTFGQESFGGKDSESPLGYTNTHAIPMQMQRGSDGEKQEGGPYHLVSIPRNAHQSLNSQGTNGYSVQVPSSVSVIAKPVSSGSPTGLRQQQMKTLQQQQQQHPLDSQQQQQQQQTHGPISFSPFGYGMPQGANAFGPIGGVPSPPSIYAQKSTPLYQPFNHHDNTHVLGGSGRSHSGYGSYTGVGTGVGVGGGGNPYGGSLYLQPFENYAPYGTQGGPPPQPASSLQLQSNNRISPGLPPTSGSGLSLSSPAPGNNAFKAVRNLNPNSISHPSLHHQNNQQPFSQITHHMAHPHLTPIGPQKQSPYSQQPLQPQSQQLYIPFDPNQQSLMNLGGNYGGLRSGAGTSSTPPMQGLPTSSYYAPNPGVNQGYPQQNPQPGVPGGLQGMPPGSNPHYGIQYQPTNIQQFNSQGPTGNVLGNSRPQHGNRK